MSVAKAESFFTKLNGIFCVYKPTEMSVFEVAKKLKKVLCEELNNMETRPPKNFIEVIRKDGKISLNVRPSYADNVLCVGPRYQSSDIWITYPTILSPKMSGVLLVGINEGQQLIRTLYNLRLTRCFHLKGILGQATENFFTDSKVLCRANYNKLEKYHVEKVLASFQSFNQRKLFQEYGVNMADQAAYELAVKGLFRPRERGSIVLYSLALVDFKPPNFTIEVQCVNETENYLKALIHDVGVKTKALATCAGMRCIRQGCFNLEHSLLIKHWTVENIIDNIDICHDMLAEHCFNKDRDSGLVESSDKKNVNSVIN